MERASNIIGRVKATWGFLVFAALVLIYLPIQIILALVWPSKARLPGHYFFKVFNPLAGIKVTQMGAPFADRESGEGLLIASNHVSYWDVAALAPLLPLTLVAKSEVAGWPLIGTCARLGGVVFVNRNSRQATGKATDSIESHLAKGEAVVFFPEGTSSDGLRVLPFKSALFGAVDKGEADYWVQPVSLTYRSWAGLPMNRRVRPSYAWYGDMDFVPHKWGSYMEGPFEIVARFHPPMRRAEFASRKEMAAYMERVIRAGFDHDLAGRAGEPVLPPRPAQNENDAAPQVLAAE